MERGGAYLPTPLVYGDHLYVCRDNGALSCYDARSGRRRYQERLGSGSSSFSASGVAAGGRLFFTSELGDVYVVRAGPEYELLAESSLNEMAMATPAISEGVIYFRTRSNVVAVGEAGGGREAASEVQRAEEPPRGD
jgi:outer membrane protein assembly factor BamB